MKIIKILIVLAILTPFVGCAQKQEKVVIETTYGNIKIRLYNETPLHRDNFLKLIREGYYDGLLFHRVISEFMIQGGDPNSRNAMPGIQLGNGGPDYTIDAEINYPLYFHKKGALAAARTGDQVNPQKKSSGSQFYIVQGQVYTNEEIDQFEKVATDRKRQSVMMKYMNNHRDTYMQLQQSGDNEGIQQLIQKVTAEAAPEMNALEPVKILPEHRKVYTTLGGTPHLDNAYTVFGEVESGLEVIDSIAAVETNEIARPLKDVIMKIKVIKE